MELIINNKESINNFVKWANKSKSAEEIAELIGELDREAYFSLLEDWKACLHEVVEGVRNARVMRKTAPTEQERNHWNYHRWLLRYKGNALMEVRAGIKVLARRHWEAKQDSKAA